MKHFLLFCSLISSLSFGVTVHMQVSPQSGSNVAQFGYVDSGFHKKDSSADDEFNKEKIIQEAFRNTVIYTPPLWELQAQTRTLVEAKNRLVKQAERRNAAREQVKSMDHSSQRSAIVEEATEALKLSRTYYLEDKYEEGAIAGNIADVLLDLATSMTPVVSWVRDTYEAISGKDLLSGEMLSSFSRSMAVLGAVTGGFGSKAFKAFHVFEKLALASPRGKLVKDIVTQVEMDVKIVFDGGRKLLHSKTLAEIKQTTGFFKKYKIYDATDANARIVANAFMRGAKTEILKEDLKVYRYYTDGFSRPRGAWVSPVKLSNPKQALALEKAPTGMVEWIIPKGTEILRGHASENFNEVGGAVQILVGKDFLKEFL